MAWGATILRLTAAALVSSLTAGMLMLLLLLTGPFLGERPIREAGEPPALELMLWTLRYGIEGAFLLAALPALVAGAAMHALGRRHPAARRSLAWAAAGAVVGALLFLPARWAVGMDLFALPVSGLEAAAGAAFLAAGAGAALAFQAVMWMSAPFDPRSED